MRTDEKNRVRYKWFEDGPAKCHWCGRVLHLDKNRNDGAFCTIDHLEEQAVGGSDHESNLVPACRKCNEGRSTGVYRGPVGRGRAVLDASQMGAKL